MWEYSHEAVNLIKDFKAQFPEVVDALEKNPDGKHYSLEEIMPGIEDRNARLEKLMAWLAEVGLHAGGQCRPLPPRPLLYVAALLLSVFFFPHRQPLPLPISFSHTRAGAANAASSYPCRLRHAVRRERAPHRERRARRQVCDG